MLPILDEHLGYVADAVRLERFRTAIAQVIKPGDTVADLGCGSGILGLLCLQAGAAHVYAIDDSAMLDVAKQTLQQAGYEGSATFIAGKSSQINLPQPVDVIICDHVGYFGIDYGILAFFQDAKQRFLKPGGTLLPRQIQLNLAAVGSEKCHALVNGWQKDGIPKAFHWLRHYAVNAKHAIKSQPQEILSTTSVLGMVNLYDDHPDFFAWNTQVTMVKEEVMQGIVGWFDCELAENVWMSNSPMTATAIDRNQAFLPIQTATPVKPGDTINITIMARPKDHLLAWSVEFLATGQRFSHSTWEGMLVNPKNIHQAHPTHTPTVNQKAIATMAILNYCDSKRTTQDIQRAVLNNHPHLFPSVAEITDFIDKVLVRYTE
jgi:ubiquinone/menaquinone biosynthesis C-methylase UbiE